MVDKLSRESWKSSRSRRKAGECGIKAREGERRGVSVLRKDDTRNDSPEKTNTRASGELEQPVTA